MKILLTVLMTWLSSNFDLPLVHELPDVRLVNNQQMATMRYGAAVAGQAGELVAIYHDKTRTVLLSERWTDSTPADVSVLVHELVHHMQNEAKLTYPCPAAREALAYAAQEKWLGLFGQSLLSEFDMDPLTLKVRTTCM